MLAGICPLKSNLTFSKGFKKSSKNSFGLVSKTVGAEIEEIVGAGPFNLLVKTFLKVPSFKRTFDEASLAPVKLATLLFKRSSSLFKYPNEGI